jgi:positive regulator of sigma E activity
MSSCTISGVTSNELALVAAHENFTNCPGAINAGDTVKLDTMGGSSVPPSALLAGISPLLLFTVAAELLEALLANAVEIRKKKRTRIPAKKRSLDIPLNLPMF